MVIFTSTGTGDLFDYNPMENTFPASTSDTTLPSWIKHECATLFLPTMDRPKHGMLIRDEDKWGFRCDKGSTSKLYELVDFYSTVRDMIKEIILFQGHKHFKEIFHLRSTIQLKSAVANHVSARGLSSLVSPNSLRDHRTMIPSDKKIWDATYMEE